MSDELRLPDDLAACEARLAGLALPASGIDRDQLMYRAGWAAGAETARLAVVNPSPLQGGARGGIAPPRATALWSTASAAIAASLAVAVTLQFRPVDEGGLSPLATKAQPADSRIDDRSLADAAGSLKFQVVNPPTSTSAAALANRRTPNEPVMVAAMLAARNQSLRLAADDRPATRLTAATSTADAYGPIAKTARELMDEYLPDNSRENAADDLPRSRISWPWNSVLPGETI